MFSQLRAYSLLCASLSLLACDPNHEGEKSGKGTDSPSPQGEDSAAKAGKAAHATTPARMDAREAHAFDALDLITLDRISDPQLSPDETSVVFVRRRTDLEADKGRSDLCLLDLKTKEIRVLDDHIAGDSQPRWIPKSKDLLFISSRSGSSQIWKIATEGASATPKQISDLPLSVSNLTLAPNGETIAFTAEVPLDCPSKGALECSKEWEKAQAKRKDSAKVYDKVFVRHWDHWKDSRRSHLFTASFKGDAISDVIDVTQGFDGDIPSQPFGGGEDFTFTPDSTELVFSSRRQGDALEPTSTNFDLFYVPADGSQKPIQITKNPAWDSHPVFSPDGKTLAYLAMKRPGFEADRFRIMLQPWTSSEGKSLGHPEGEAKALTENWDRSVADFRWAKDQQSLLAIAQDTGQKPLFSIAIADGKVQKLVEEGTFSSPIIGEENIYVLRNDLSHPADLWQMKLDASAPEQLTQLNKDELANARMGKAEQFSFKGANNDTVYGWVVQPTNFDPEERYPVAFLIHGGPQGSFANRFHYRWNPQTYAGKGYAVVMIDFHGSTGYGQDFTDAIRGDWGGKPLEDLQKGLAAAIKRYPWLDKDEVCALGASYGGYMINWIAGNWSDRFKCLINHDGIFDNRSMYYSTEELWFPEWEHGGPYYENPAGYERHNPANHVKNWQTPMLVIQGELDYRVPVEQALDTFTALQRKGVESRLVYFPDENHWVLKPNNSLKWHEEVEAWLGKHLKAPGSENGEEAAPIGKEKEDA